MDKHMTREWIISLEVVLDNKLKKWRKEPKIENGEATQLHWRFEQSHFLIDIFWEDHEENIHFQFHSPRSSHRFEWHGLTDKTFNRIVDRVGNLSQIAMHPPIDPELDE